MVLTLNMNHSKCISCIGLLKNIILCYIYVIYNEENIILSYPQRVFVRQKFCKESVHGHI